jgi:hypothetical protein
MLPSHNSEWFGTAVQPACLPRIHIMPTKIIATLTATAGKGFRPRASGCISISRLYPTQSKIADPISNAITPNTRLICTLQSIGRVARVQQQGPAARTSTLERLNPGPVCCNNRHSSHVLHPSQVSRITFPCPIREDDQGGEVCRHAISCACRARQGVEGGSDDGQVIRA